MNARWSTLWEIPEAIGFIIANRVKGNFDPAIFRYPTLKVMRTENGQGGALVYLPVHSAAILESVGWAPDLDAEHKVEAGITALEQVEREAWAAGYREVFFISSDERTDRFCQEQLGYEAVKVLRKKL